MNWLHRGALATWLAWAALAPLAGSAHAQEAAVVKRATQLRDTPADSGASVAPLEANTVVTRSNERKGPWTKVSTQQGATGWVHMFDLGPQSGSATPTNRSKPLLVVPLPTWPPAAAVTTVLAICTGFSRSFVDPSPNCPKLFEPIAHKVPSDLINWLC